MSRWRCAVGSGRSERCSRTSSTNDATGRWYRSLPETLAELHDEELGLAHGIRIEGRHDEKRRAVVEQRAGHRLRPFDETVVHGLEENEELGDVLQELCAQHSIGNAVERLRRGREQPRAIGR